MGEMAADIYQFISPLKHQLQVNLTEKNHPPLCFLLIRTLTFSLRACLVSTVFNFIFGSGSAVLDTISEFISKQDQTQKALFFWNI